MQEQAERPPGVCLAFEDVNGQARLMPELDGGPVLRFDKDDAIEATEDLDLRVLDHEVGRVADGEDEPLLVDEGLHAL